LPGCLAPTISYYGCFLGLVAGFLTSSTCFSLDGASATLTKLMTDC